MSRLFTTLMLLFAALFLLSTAQASVTLESGTVTTGSISGQDANGNTIRQSFDFYIIGNADFHITIKSPNDMKFKFYLYRPGEDPTIECVSPACEYSNTRQISSNGNAISGTYRFFLETDYWVENEPYEINFVAGNGNDDQFGITSGADYFGRINGNELESYTFEAQVDDMLNLTIVADDKIVTYIHSPDGKILGNPTTQNKFFNAIAEQPGTHRIVLRRRAYVEHSVNFEYSFNLVNIGDVVRNQEQAVKNGQFAMGTVMYGNMEKNELHSYTFDLNEGDRFWYAYQPNPWGLLKLYFYKPDGTYYTSLTYPTFSLYKRLLAGKWTVLVHNISGYRQAPYSLEMVVY